MISTLYLNHQGGRTWDDYVGCAGRHAAGLIEHNLTLCSFAFVLHMHNHPPQGVRVLGSEPVNERNLLNGFLRAILVPVALIPQNRQPIGKLHFSLPRRQLVY